MKGIISLIVALSVIFSGVSFGSVGVDYRSDGGFRISYKNKSGMWGVGYKNKKWDASFKNRKWDVRFR